MMDVNYEAMAKNEQISPNSRQLYASLAILQVLKNGQRGAPASPLSDLSDPCAVLAAESAHECVRPYTKEEVYAVLVEEGLANLTKKPGVLHQMYQDRPELVALREWIINR